MKQSAAQINQTTIPVFISVSSCLKNWPHTALLKVRFAWAIGPPTFDVAATETTATARPIVRSATFPEFNGLARAAAIPWGAESS
jgi:hypothetical protein